MRLALFAFASFFGLVVGTNTLGLYDIWAVMGFAAVVGAASGAGSILAERKLQPWLIQNHDDFGTYYENRASTVLASGWIFPLGLTMGTTAASIFWFGLLQHVLWGILVSALAVVIAFVVFWVVYLVVNAAAELLLAHAPGGANLAPSRA